MNLKLLILYGVFPSLLSSSSSRSSCRPHGTPASAPAVLLSAIGAPPGEARARGGAHRLGQDGCREEQAHVATGASLSGVELGLWGGVGGGAVDERWMGYGELLRLADSTATANGPWRKWRERKKKGLTSGTRGKNEHSLYFSLLFSLKILF
ncbi:hypothetical protein SETIT_9G506600v2 [Setaria italica]|uniref:Uncharacterized protein n=1 Tax=Setaria italica TaxID=4555 RepID=A0A368SUL4_SETIT|nr:hypothetical protein SETIT_9G506600v2 [Setaria italica]